MFLSYYLWCATDALYISLLPVSPLDRFSIILIWWSIHFGFSLHFNGHFPCELGLAGVYWSKGWWRWWKQLDYWSYKSCKTPVKSSLSTNQHPVFLQARCPSCRPTNSVKALKGKISHSMDLLTPSSLGGLPTLSLTAIHFGLTKLIFFHLLCKR